MGYIIAAGLFLLIAIVVVAAMKPGAHATGKLTSGHPIEPDRPAADEPTPGASATNDPDTVQHAQRHIPPA
jgi:hypothetical protein